MSNTAKATGNDQSNNVNITASDVTAIPSGNGHGSCDKSTSSNKSVSNTAKATENDQSNNVDLTASDLVVRLLW